MTHRLKIIEAMDAGHKTPTTISGFTGLHSQVVRRELALMHADGLVSMKNNEGKTGWQYELTGASKACQGHVYLHRGKKVMALQNGIKVKVAEVVEGDEQWPLREHYECNANALRPLPMRYFQGDTPN